MRYTANDCVGCPDGCRFCGRDRDFVTCSCDVCGHDIDLDTENAYHFQQKDYCHDCFREKLIDFINDADNISIDELASLAKIDYKEVTSQSEC